jgi:hypothetical protein
MAEIKKKLGELLVEGKLIDDFQLRSGLAHQKQWGSRLGHNLIKLGFITEDTLLKFLSRQFSLPCVDFAKVRIPPSVLKLVPEHLVKKHHIMPISVKENEKGKKFLFLSTADPTNFDAIDEIQFTTGLNIKPVISTEASIGDAITYYYDGLGQHPAEKARNLAASGNGNSAGAGAQVTGEREISLPTTERVPAAKAVAAPAPQVIEDAVIVKDTPDEFVVLSDDDNAVSEGSPMPAQPSEAIFALMELLVEKGYITKEEFFTKLKGGN